MRLKIPKIKGDSFNAIFNIKGLTNRFRKIAPKFMSLPCNHWSNARCKVTKSCRSADTDCIIVDEAHGDTSGWRNEPEGELKFREIRSDYISSYRRIIDHFDAVKVALTRQRLRCIPLIFLVAHRKHQPIVIAYRKAVIDGYLCNQEPPIKITTKLSEQGVSVLVVVGCFVS